ncbi:helix-turn-helix transcriptional regulator [Streptomyces sp. NPDC005151]
MADHAYLSSGRRHPPAHRTVRARAVHRCRRLLPHGRILQTLDEILTTPHPTHLRQHEFRYLLLAELLALADAHTHAAATPTKQAPLHPGIANVLALIERSLERPLSVADLAAHARLSTSRFYDVFTSQVGTTPKDHVHRRKMEHARRLLRDHPHLTVTEVAHRVGFSSSQYFASVYRRYYATSPSTDRRPTAPSSVPVEGLERPTPPAHLRSTP